MRSLGAIAHFDPSWGASDNGTTSTWVDRINGYQASSTSAGTRLVYSASLAGLNSRPGWTGVEASLTKLVSASSALNARLTGSAPYTMYAVKKSAAPTITSVLFSAQNAAFNQSFYHGVINSSAAHRLIHSRSDGVQTTNSGSVIRPGVEATVTSIAYSGSAYSGYDNGGPSALAEANVRAAAISDGLFCIGGLLSSATIASNCFDGVIGDIIIFPTAHTDAQRRYVEQLIAAKYGWPCIQGLSGFTAANYLENAGLTSGIRGSAGTGVWADVLFRPDVLPAAEQQYMASSYTAATGSIVYASGTSLLGFAGNGSVGAASPARTLAAADIGKLGILGMTAGPGNLIRAYFNSAEIGAGTALTGYAPNASLPYRVGATATNASVFMSIFGVAGGNVEQALANHQARAAAIKAAGGFVATGGATLTHAWALDSDAATIADVVGSDTLTLAGTLARAQIIVPTWPW